MTYYNTTFVRGQQLAEYTRLAEAQEDRVHEFFRANTGLLLSPEDVHEHVLPTAPRRSIARCLANLTEAGVLVKTDHQVPGRFGRPVHCWRYNDHSQQYPRQCSMFYEPGEDEGLEFEND